jgi:hypothetical protein
VVFCTFSCARQLASPCTHTPAESSSSPLPRSTTSRCWIPAPHNHHQSVHLWVLSQIILPQKCCQDPCVHILWKCLQWKKRKTLHR